MPIKIPHTLPFPWNEAAPGRLASRIHTESFESCQVALLGIPDDTGVGMNNGRLGAAQGPGAFRAALSRYGAAQPAGIDLPGVFDAGDVEPGASLEETHTRVTEAAGALIDAGLLPVMIGGGHDLTYPFVQALAQRTETPLHGVYLDAHLDVRAETGSGMPFRRLVEDCGVRSLTVHGLDPFANSTEHMTWFSGNGGRVGTLGPDEPSSWPAVDASGGSVFVSFDIDVLDQSVAPGVSAMNPSGWSADLGCAWARAAGRHASVRCFDIMELSPPHDEHGRTARVAARLFLEFLAGFAERDA